MGLFALLSPSEKSRRIGERFCLKAASLLYLRLTEFYVLARLAALLKYYEIDDSKESLVLRIKAVPSLALVFLNSSVSELDALTKIVNQDREFTDAPANMIGSSPKKRRRDDFIISLDVRGGRVRSTGTIFNEREVKKNQAALNDQAVGLCQAVFG